jgi:predicted outer membrane repeat protein
MTKETFCKEGTPEKVKQILEKELHSHNRLRIFYGDKDTGLDWMEEHDTIGYIGRSTGESPITILLNNNRSYGGGAILTDCIVKITKDKTVLYQHPNYHYNKLSLGNPIDNNFQEAVYQEENNKLELVAQFENIGQGKRWIDFMEGRRNSK